MDGRTDGRPIYVVRPCDVKSAPPPPPTPTTTSCPNPPQTHNNKNMAKDAYKLALPYAPTILLPTTNYSAAHDQRMRKPTTTTVEQRRRRTTNDEQRTTNDERRTMNDDSELNRHSATQSHYAFNAFRHSLISQFHAIPYIQTIRSRSLAAAAALSLAGWLAGWLGRWIVCGKCGVFQLIPKADT